MLRENIKVALVIPCFNEATRLIWEPFRSFLETHPDFMLLFVDDGSNDTTIEVLENFKKETPDQITVISLAMNNGKAEAVRAGMITAILNNSKLDYLGYWDADLSTPLSTVEDFLHVFEGNDQIMFVSGARIKRGGANISRDPLRHYLGRIFATIIGVLFGLEIYDTQCGAKLFKATVIRLLFEETFTSRWLFDVELILRMLDTNPMSTTSYYEFPLLSWTHVGNSKVNAITYFSASWDLFRICRRYRKRWA